MVNSKLENSTAEPLPATLLREALSFSGRVKGKTHNFYNYPARFSPEFAREFITQLSKPGDWVLDPFMGGATSIVEGISLGRRMIGTDLNSLSHFIATARTTPLSLQDIAAITSWVALASEDAVIGNTRDIELPGVKNLPTAIQYFLARAMSTIDCLDHPRQRQFARCALLRLGQWALDCRDFAALRRTRLAQQFPVLVASMLGGLGELVEKCGESGVSKNLITGRRILLHRSAVGLDTDRRLRSLHGKVKLVLTSPPYPAVHVLYHRWQVRGRKETPAPYWIADVPDGQPESFYTFGGRKGAGLIKYFQTVNDAFTSIRPLLAPDAVVAQLVAFSDIERHLPPYLEAMHSAGFDETTANGLDSRQSRAVPSRKWYVKSKPGVETGTEMLLLHKPSDRLPSTAPGPHLLNLKITQGLN